jgi:hypothetical protein
MAANPEAIRVMVAGSGVSTIRGASAIAACPAVVG